LDPACGLLKNERQFIAASGRLDAALLQVWASLKVMRSGPQQFCPTSQWTETEVGARCFANVIPPIIGQILRRTLRLRDITDSPSEFLHREQNGRAFPADKKELSCGSPENTGTLALSPVLNTDQAACGMSRLITTPKTLP